MTGRHRACPSCRQLLGPAECNNPGCLTNAPTGPIQLDQAKATAEAEQVLRELRQRLTRGEMF